MKTQNLSNKLTRIFLLIFSLSFSNCSEDKPEKKIINPIDVSSIAALDIGNEISAEDIQVRFTFNKIVDNIKLLILPTSMVGSITENELLNASEDRFMNIPGQARTNYSVRLDNITDINGEAILNETGYSIALIYTKDEQSYISDKYANISLTDKHPLLGNYAGLWNDNLFTDVNISFRLENEDMDKLTGAFFATGTFSPFGGGALVDDGTITLELSKDQKGSFDSFRYDQNLPTYQGGCPGLYVGNGTFKVLEISISFTGDDCDGNHTGGSIKVVKQF